MRFIPLFGLLFFSVLFNSSLAQKPSEPVNSGQLLEKGIKLHDDDDFSGALEFYEKIPRNDTNYIVALYERSMTLNAMKKYDEAVAVAREGLKFKSEYDSKFYLSLGNSLDELGKKEEAIEAYSEGIKRFPYNNMLYFNRAIALRKADRHQDAANDLKVSIRLNPLHASSHFLLGSMALLEDKIIEGLLALNTYLLLEPVTERSRTVVGWLDQLNRDKFETDIKGVNFCLDGEDFSEIDVLMRNRVFDNKNFKVSIKLDFFFVKQNYLLFQQLADNESKYQKGFFSETYVPFYISLYRKGFFDEFTLYELLTVQTEQVQKLVKKNSSGIKKFIAWGADEYRVKAGMHRIQWEGKEQAVRHWYYGASHLQSVGNADATGTKAVGYWENFHSFGCVSEQVNYDNSGNRQGVSKSFYPTGELEREVSYKDGKADGFVKGYYKNGSLSFHNELKNDIRHGKARDYFLDGTPQSEFEFADGKRNGRSVIFHPTNTVKYEVDYKDDLFSGKIIEYYPSGEKRYEGEYLNGELSGSATYYYRDGKIEGKYTFLNGKRNGPFETYFENGKIQSKGTMKNNNKTGKFESWFENGEPYEQEEYDEDGKGNGIMKEYDESGRLYFESDVKKGYLVSYKYYDSNGKILSEGKEDKGKLIFKGHYTSGEVFSKGEMVKGKREGVWSFYNRQGILYSEEVYKNDEITERRYLFTNGSIREITRFKDGLAEGPFESWYYNGKYYQTGWYFKGERNGYWYTYHPDGKISETNYYLNDQPYGSQVDYSASGSISAENYSNLDGQDIRWIFYDTIGKVIDDVDFGTTTGELIRHYPNGGIRFKGNYKNDWGHGDFSWFYFNGKHESRGSMAHGKRVGYWKGYYLNGVMRYQGKYVNGQKDSAWTYYNESGKVESIQIFDKGDDVGEWTTYHENGQVATKKSYWKDWRHGPSTYYSEDGQLRMVKTFFYGKMVSYSYMLPDGKMSPEKKVESGKGLITAYYKNGNKSEEFSMDKFELDGKYVIYWPNGQVYERSEYKGGIQEGLQETFYSNGKLMASENYLNDDLHGISVFYDQSGNITKELSYKYGELHGLCKYYEKGKLVRTRVYYDNIMYSEDVFK